MKTRAILSLTILLCGGLAASSQTFTNWDADTIFAFVRTNIFDLGRPFSAVAEVQLENGLALQMDAGISTQDGNLRVYSDFSTLKNASLPAGLLKRVLETVQKAGLSRFVVIMRKGDGTKYTLYPDRRTYRTNDFRASLPQYEDTNSVTLTQAPAGEETVEGHDCRKIQWQMTVGKETATFLTIWRARDMNDFPEKIQVANEVSIVFKQIKFARLDPMLFEIPSGYKRLESIEAVVADARGGRNPPEPDTKEAMAARVLKWHQELADQGDRYGQYLMGLRYQTGDGVKKDLDKAQELLQKSADQGSQDAVAALAKLPPPAARKPDGKLADITILSAAFGVGNRQADVTARLVDLLRVQPDGFVVSVGSLQTNLAPGKRHRLTIQYDFEGEHYSFAMPAQNRLSYQTLIKNAQE